MFKFHVPKHEFVLEEAIEASGDSNAFRFAMRVDGIRFNELPDVDGISAAEAELFETQLGQEISRVRRKLADEEEVDEIDEDKVGCDDLEERALEASRRVVVGSNALVTLYQVQLEPGVFGTGILLRNEPSASRRIEVASISARMRVPGVSPGDVLVAINGKPLPRGASAAELQELVRSNPRYALTAVDALMWHKKIVDRLPPVDPNDPHELDDKPSVEALAGSELTINCGNGALGVEWARMVKTPQVPCDYIDGLFAAVGVRGQALNLAVKTGDLLIGIGHEPLPKDLPSATLLQRFSSAAARGPPILNLWRCYDPLVLPTILAQCQAAKKHSLCVNPSVSAHVPRRPRDKMPPSTCC